MCNYVGDIIPSNINTLCPTPIDLPPHKVHFYSTRANILVISEYGLSTCQIISKTGLRKSIMTKAIKEILSERENIKLGHPCKLFFNWQKKNCFERYYWECWECCSSHSSHQLCPSFFSLCPNYSQCSQGYIFECYNNKKDVFFSCQAQKLEFGGLDQSYLVWWDKNEHNWIRWNDLCVEKER